MITEDIEISDEIVTSGGFADIRTGMHNGHLVAVRTLKVRVAHNFPRIREVSINDIFSAARNAVLTVFPQRFCREVVLWNTLSHPNVLKLGGVYGDMGKGQFITVYEWMVHGTITEYTRKEYVNGLELVRIFSLHHFLH